jgi:hypothetical protein
MFKRISSIFVAASFLAQSTIAGAQEAPFPPAPEPGPGEVNVGAAVSPMKKGQLAPFTGVLLSPEAIARVTVELSSNLERTKIEVQKAVAEADARCDNEKSNMKTTLDADKKILSIQLDERDKRIQILNDQIEKNGDSSSNIPLWLGIGAGTGFLVGVATTVVIVYSVNQAQN